MGLNRKIVTAALALLLLPACAASAGGISYKPGGNGPDSVAIRGLDADYLEYTSSGLSSEGGFLYFASPRFLGSAFSDEVTEGTASLEDGRITVNFVRGDDKNSGTVSGPSVSFTVDLSSQTVSDLAFAPHEETTLSLTDQEMGQIGQELAKLIQGAMDYSRNQ